jgi:hypothetical protein
MITRSDTTIIMIVYRRWLRVVIVGKTVGSNIFSLSFFQMILQRDLQQPQYSQVEIRMLGYDGLVVQVSRWVVLVGQVG